jgi:hypothetical protein
MRIPRKRTRLWVRASTLRQTRYLEIVQANEGALREEYFRDIEKRRSAAASQRLIAFAIQIPIFAFLALSLIPGGSNLPADASRLSTHNLREILIVVSAVLGLGMTYVGYYHDVLTDIVAAHVESLSKGTKEVQEILKISYGLDVFPLPPGATEYRQLGWGYRLFAGSFAVFTAMILVVLAVGIIYIRVKVLENIYFQPTFSTVASVGVIGFVVMCDTLGLLILLLNSGRVIARFFEDGRSKEADRLSANAIDISTSTGGT